MKKTSIDRSSWFYRVPVTRDNHNHVGFFEMIEETLSQEYNITTKIVFICLVIMIIII